ncbi:GerW family sporulation protein [Tepidibacter formicigenes]|jgi:sporulation protein YtfJ|uniref:Sporulation protein YtfJ n=1 Tax=Tepidibacter formicigenes DSM 15518 TaxID=1123349 RepID=A0A1M6LNF6_9FIRM|nr:GerW family sporulation protein [Tepidibacter formicigenes]SHJ72749.1 sporulation protein YtfJ [Tepidibacter formicigenes DSM 15518]
MSEQQHPIESLMKTTMENMKEMIDVNTIVGDPVETSNGSVLIPISKLSFGFASGGGEYNKGQGTRDNEMSESYPFAGGAGAGITVQPVAFMVVENNETKLMYVDQNANMVDNLLNKTPKIMENIQGMFGGKGKNKDQNNNKQNNQGNSENNNKEN